MSDPSKFLVKDADTVDVRATGERLRFQGLNSPEKDTAAGPAATAFTQSVVEDYKNVQRQGYDYYGRTVADLTNDQGESLNARLIREGQAPAANFDRGPYPYASTLRQQTREQAARTSPQPQFQASEATQIAQQRYAEAAPNKQKPLGVEFGDALKRGVDQRQAEYGAAWAALGDFLADNSNGREPLGIDEDDKDQYLTFRDRVTNAMQRSGMKMYRRNVEEAKQYGQSTRLSEVDDVSSGLRWAFGVLGENLPGIVDTALSAVAGGVVGAALKKTALGVAERKFKSAARKRALEMGRTAAEAERFARRADLALWGARAGAFTASGAQITGDTYANIFNETGVRAPGRALAAGAAGGALEVLGLETVLRRVLPSAQGADGVIKAAASAAGVGAAVEGSTEAAQEVIQAIAEESAHPDWDGTAEGLAQRVFSPERREGYLEAAAAGALFGGLFGGAGGGVNAGINKLGGSSNENEDTTSGDNTAPPPPDRESTNAQTADVSPPAESGPTPDSAGSATQGRESSDPPPVRPVVRALAGAPPDTEQSPPSTLQADQSTLAGDQDAHADNQSSSQTSEPPITVDDVLQAFPEGRVTPGAIRTKFGGLRVSLEQARALAEGVETAREQKAASTQPSTQANEVVAEPDAQAGVAQDSTESAPAADAEQVNRAPTVGEMSEALKDIDHPRVEDVLRLFPDVTPAQAKKYLEHVTLQRSAKRAEQTIRRDKKKVRTPETKAAPAPETKAAPAPETKAAPPPTPGEVHAVFASQDKVTAEDVRKAFPQLTPKEAKQHRDTIMAARAAEAQATTAPATDATQTDTQQSASPPAQQEVAAPTAPNAKLQSAATAPPSPARTDASKTPTAGANQSPVSSAKAPSEDSQTIQEPTASGNKEPANIKVVLPKRNKYHAKDQAKADKANKFIGRGSEKSSTAAYGQAYGDNANSGTYTADDTVFVSAEGARKNRVAPDLQELSRAMDAGATIITDDADNRSRPYNVGEREVATHLATNGYVETAPGTWKPDPKQASTESTQDVDDGVYKTVVQEDYSDLTSPETMLDLYRRAKSEQARVAAIPESERTDRQDTLHSSLNEFFGSLMDHRTNLSEMPGFYDLPDAEQDRLFGELQRIVDSKAAPAPKAPKQNAATTSTKVLDVPAKESTPAESKPEDTTTKVPSDVSPSKQTSSSTKNQALSESAPNPAPPASTASQRTSVSIGKEGKKPVTPGALANATDEAPPPREAKPVPETVARARREVEAAQSTLRAERDKTQKAEQAVRTLTELSLRLKQDGNKPKALASVKERLQSAAAELAKRKERVKEAEEALDEAEANLKNAVAESRGLTRHNDTAESGDVELDTAGPRDDVEVTQTGEDVDPDTSVDEYESGISARDVNPLAGTLQPIRRVGDRGTNPSENWETYDERHPSMPKVRELIGNSDNLAVPVADVLDSPLFKALPAALRAPIADLVLRRFDAGIDSEIMFEVKEKDDGFLQVRVRERLPSDIAFRDTGFDVSTGLPMLAQDVLENEVQRMRDRANGRYGDKLVSPERIGFQVVIPADHPVVLFVQQVLDRVGSPDKALKVLLEMDQFKAMREYIVRTFGAANSTKGLLKLIADIHTGPGKTGWTAPERVTTTATNRVAVRSSRTSEAGVIVSSSTIWLNDFDIMSLGRRMIKNAEGGTKDFMDQVALYQLGLSMLMGRGVSLRPRDVNKALSPTARLAPGVTIASASQRAQQANRLAPRVQAQEKWLREMYELMDGWHAGTVSSTELLRRLFVLEAGGPFTSLQHLFTGRKNIPSEEREAGGVYVEDPETGEKVFQPRRIPPASYYEGLTRLKARLTEEAKASPDPDKKGLFRQLIEREAEAALAAWHKFFTSDSYMLSRMTPDDMRGKRNRMQFGYFGNVGRTVAEIESDTLHRLDTNNDGTPLDLTEIQGENEVDTADPDIRQKQQQDSERPAYDPAEGRGGAPKLPDRPTSKLPEPTSSGKENIATPLSAKGKPAPRAAGAVESAAKRQGALPPSVTSTLLVDAVPLGTTSPIGRLLQPVAKLLGIDKLPIHIHTKDSQSLIKLRDTLRDMGASKAADEIGAHVRARSLNFTVFVEGQAFIFLDPAVFGQNKIDLVNKAGPDKAWNKNQRKIAFHELGHVFLEAKLGEEELRHGPLWRKILQAAGPESPKEWAANQLITWAEGKRPAKLEDTWVARLHALLRRAAKLLGFGKKPEFDNLMHEVYTAAAYSELVSGRFTTGNGAINLSDAKDLFTKRKGPLDINALIPELVKGRYDKLDAAMSDVGGQSVISYLVNDRGFTAPATLRNTPDFRVEDWTPPMVDAVRRSAAYRTTASFANVMRETGGYLHDRITKTADSWLRTQRNAEGDSIPAIVAVADIFRAASGKARQDVRVSDVLRFNFESDRTYDEPFFPAVSRMYGTAIENQLVGAVKGLSEEQAKAMRRDLQTGRLNTREARHVRAWLDNMWSYASGGIHNLGKIERNYFPRVFDSSKIDADPEAFIAVLRRYNFSRAGAEQVIELLRGEKGVVDLAVLGDVLATGAPSTKSRGDKLKKVPDIELEPFMVDDVVSILHRYAHTMIKRTEFERRFSGWVAPDGSYVDEAIVQSRISRDGNLYHFIMRGGDKVFVHRSSNAKYQAIRQAAVDQGASADQIASLDGHINAYLGRLGADMPPRARAAMSTMVAIQNWALLPLSLFSSIVDAGNTVLRTNGDLKSSWKGMQAAISAWKQKDQSMLYRMAVVNGKVVNSMQSDLASNYFDQPWLEGKAALWNERLFRINGMHWWSNFSRTYALATGEEFFKDLAQRNDAESRRLLAQFNLTPQEVNDWVASGMPRWTEGGDDNGSRKVQLALNRFAYESVLSPDATQRPKWASHPAAMMVWHLKQFAFSFYDVILRRMWAEVKDAPTIRKKAMLAILPALVLMPLAVAGTMLRDILRYNLPWQEEPKVEKEGFDAFMYAVSRAGILGPAQIMMDAYQAAEWGNNFVFALSGPTLNMFGELMFDQQHFSALTKILPVIPTLPTEREAIRSYLAELLEDAKD